MENIYYRGFINAKKGIFISKKAAKGLDIPVTGRCMVVVDKITRKEGEP